MPPLNLLRGLGLVSLAVLVFAFGDVATKYLSQRYPVPLVIAIRYGVNLLLVLAIFLPRLGRDLWRTERTGLVLVRGACLASASLTMGFALQRLPLAEMISIVFLAPFGVMLLSGMILDERPGLAGWLAALAGFAGVLLVVRPGAGLDPVGVLWAVGTAASTVGYNLLSRVLARTEKTEPMILFAAGLGTVVFGVTLPAHLPGFAPGPFDLMVFLALGVLASLGHLLFTAAFRHAPAHVLAPVAYVHLVWAGILGAVFFGQRPDGYGILGMAVIAGAGVTVALRARRPSPRPEPEVVP